MTLAHRLRRLGRRLIRDEGGNAAVIMALAILPLAAGAGLATDSMLAFTVEDQLQKSLDAAGLAAGNTQQPENVEADARSFFNANFGSGAQLAQLQDLEVMVNDAGDELTLTATARMQTRFMRLFGHDTVDVSARTVINRETRGMELALVLDITGSMVTDNKIGGLKAAAHDLLDILYGQKDTVHDLWVGVVPYIAAVNVGAVNQAFLASTDRVFATLSPFRPDSWGGCVLARAAPYDQTDDPPSVRKFSSYLYPDLPNPNWSGWQNDWGTGRSPQTRKYLAYQGGVSYWEGYGPNVGCPPAITPLVTQKSRVSAAIDELQPWSRGGTIINEGLAWGWRVLSPRWRSLWSGSSANLPLDYHAAGTDKVIVLLTDGDNQMLVQSYNGSNISPYTAYQSHTTLGVNSTNAAKTVLDTRTTAVCSAIKQQGIIVYTISLGDVPSAQGQSLLRACATKPADYFHSPDNAALRTAFRTIGGQLSNLRIAR